MLTFKDFAVGQIYRSGPCVVPKDEVQILYNALGGTGAFELLSFAEQSIFNQWAASSLTMKLVATGELQVVGGTQGLGVEELEWGVPIKGEDTLRLESCVTMVRESRSDRDFGIIKLQTTTRNQDGEVVQILTHAIRVAK
jgi:acyl dehydratase